MPSVKVCPKCGSENVKVDPTNPASALGFITLTYLCGDCSFSGQFFPEIEKETQHAVPKDNKKQQKEKA